MNMSYKYRYDEDNRKKVLTKGSIAKELNKKNKIAIIGLSISLPLLLLVWLLALNILDSYYGGWPFLILTSIITATALSVLGFYVLNYVRLSKGNFSVVTDKVLNNDMGDAPRYLKPSRRNGNTINDIYGLLNFYDYGWVKTDVENYKLTDRDDECYIVVINEKKKKAIWSYNKKFYEYKE